ncbi:MAG: hypothetical protein JNJ54_19470 [Myxococcaceae bacterium]|nr:hypothetical protein [Myxococcaceae bacterium]
MASDNPPRWGPRLVVAGLALLPVGLVAGLVVASELRARRLAEQLLVDAAALSRFSRDRPPHREASPGPVADCLARALDTAPDVSRDAPWMSVPVNEVRAGRAPLEALPAAALEALAKHDPWLRETLACTHLTTLAPVPGLGPLAEPLHPRRQALPRLQEATASLAPLRVRALLQHGQHQEALDVCADGLALVSDLLWLEGPEAALGSLGQSTGLATPCAEAVWRAPDDEARARFVGQLEQLMREAPPYSHVMRVERVAQELRMFGMFFTTEQTARLPPGARTMVATSASLARGRQERVGLANWWSACDRAFLAVIAAADLSEPSRTRSILTAQRGFESRWLSLVRVPPLDVRYQMYAESHEALPMSLELVLAAAALRRGQPPVTRYIELRGDTLTPKTAEWRALAIRLPPR